MRILALVVTLGLCTSISWADVRDEIKDSLVRIDVTYQSVDYYHPWRWSRISHRKGQGLVIGQNRILTLASLLKKSRMVGMRLGSEPLSTKLKIVHLDIDRNLAILEGELPEGCVAFSIPEKSDYVASADIRFFWKEKGKFLEGSAILDKNQSYLSFPSNQGHLVMSGVNSSSRAGFGEPVFLGDKFIGLSTRGRAGADFFILRNEIIHKNFDLSTGEPRRKTAMPGFSIGPCTQPYLRKTMGLENSKSGCLVRRVYEQGSGSGTLKKGDILLKLAGQTLDAWGNFEDENFGLLSYIHLFSEFYLGEKMDAVILRNGEEISLAIDLAAIDEQKWLVPRYREGEASEYLVRGGYVFQPLSLAYLKAWGSGWSNKAPENLLVGLEKNMYKVKNDEVEELVVFSQVLPLPSNRGLQGSRRQVISSINGMELKNLSELRDIIDSEDGEDVLKITLSPGNEPIWLSRKEMRKANVQVQRSYGIKKLEYFHDDSL